MGLIEGDARSLDYSSCSDTFETAQFIVKGRGCQQKAEAGSAMQADKGQEMMTIIKALGHSDAASRA